MLGILPDKKKMGAVIMAKMSGDGKDEFKQGEETELDSSYAFEDAAKRMISAFEAKDPKSLVSAMKEMYQLCELYCEEEDDMSEGPENGNIA